MKIFIFHHGLLTAGFAKTTAHRVLFLVSMDSQRSKKFDGSHFWALECLLTASGWLESIRGHNGPALTLNVIPEPDRNRVNRLIMYLWMYLLTCWVVSSLVFALHPFYVRHFKTFDSKVQMIQNLTF